MGGPQSPSTTREECPHFDAAAECALIARCVAAGKALVGVCLGAQLLGTALGARHEVVVRMIAASARELAESAGHRFVQQPAALRASRHEDMNRRLFGFLDRLMEAYAARADGAALGDGR
jgi:anthranilate/para-aminobenzoate synthase component II